MVRSVLCPRLVDLGSHALVDLSKTISIDLNGSPLVLATAKQSIPLKHGSTMRVGRVVAVIESSLISASIKDVASTKDQPNLERDIVKLSLLPGTNAATRKALKARFSNLTGSKKLQSLLKSRCGEYQHADASDRIVLLEEVYQQFISAGADMWRCTGLGKYERLQKIEALDLLRRKCLYLKIPKLDERHLEEPKKCRSVERSDSKSVVGEIPRADKEALRGLQALSDQPEPEARATVDVATSTKMSQLPVMHERVSRLLEHMLERASGLVPPTLSDDERLEFRMAFEFLLDHEKGGLEFVSAYSADGLQVEVCAQRYVQYIRRLTPRQSNATT